MLNQMFRHPAILFVIFGLASFLRLRAGAEEVALRRLVPGTNEAAATLHVLAAQRSDQRIPPYITGKFAEHLGQNIYNGMWAQILHNPTLAQFPFATGDQDPDGVAFFKSDRDGIRESLEQYASRSGWPKAEVAGLISAYEDGLAAFWTREGAKGDVWVSPDTGEFGGRAQRVEVKSAGQGIAQWTYLPLHRIRQYNYEIMARSPTVTELSVSLTPAGDLPGVSARIPGLTTKWRKFTGTLELNPGVPADSVVRLALTANQPGQFVLQHLFLQPADNIRGCDPDIIRFLKDAHLPLLRWPGGNFVSSYHWRDGIGPVEQRPTKPNYAWGAIEPNLFGTDEFMEFCRAVGCDPMICINGGDGTPEEAARWIEYCNGPAGSPMGKLRAANGHPEPYGVKIWEVGNELWGRWQFNWTTPNGYLDRYQQFAPAMLKADPNIHLLACGIPVFWSQAWNDALIDGATSQLHCITDHPLIGGGVPASTDPLDVYRDFMAVPEVLESKWAITRDHMLKAGFQEPHLAVTELQLFAHVDHGAGANEETKLTSRNLPGQPTITEAVYDTLVYHAALRLGSFVELITHSAIVNHGAGLRKEHERVYANPAYYAQAGFAEFANATPVGVEITGATLQAPRVISDLKEHVSETSYSAVDALAAIATNGDLLISIVNRDTKPVHLSTEFEGFRPAGTVEEWRLGADVPWAVNSLSAPEEIKPVISTAMVQDGKLELDLKPFGIVRLRLPAER
ncbi:MAG: alpha-L-arabinofuranosidase C-terminal domain-containing protein [Verrucomicrobiota bacterium]